MFKGGDKPHKITVNKLNRFNEKNMELHLNPIYGVILSSNGYLMNHIILTHINFTNNLNQDHFNIIKKTCVPEVDTWIIRPTGPILSSVTPKDIGIFIATKYVNKLLGTKKLLKNNGSKYLSDHKITKDNLEILAKASQKLNKYIGLDNDDIFAFHMLLFCLWWTANNDAGINEYYEGIDEVFAIVKEVFKADNPLDRNKIQLNRNYNFEQTIIDITIEPFKIYSQQWSKHFCNTSQKPTYPDCGETTARNLINLLCYDGNAFDISLLEEKGAIPELIEYYKTFNNFDKQSSTELTEIYGMQLNARDAWSKFIIEKSNTNLKFAQSCLEPAFSYELDYGKALDGTNNNFLQLLQNIMTNVKDWNSLLNKNIVKITNNLNDELGTIFVTSRDKNEFVIKFMKGHYYMHLPKKMNNQDFSHFNSEDKEFLNTLLENNINKDNYLKINFTSELLVKTFENNATNSDFLLLLIELALTIKYDSDLRSRIKIDVNANWFNAFANNYGANPKINDFTYLITDNFEFVRTIPGLKILNCVGTSVNSERIDLSPLTQIEIIGDNFLKDYKIKSLDMSSLVNIKEIGNNFLFCKYLETVIFSSMPNLIKIKDNFIRYSNIQNIILDMPNIEYIGNYFLSNSEITKVDISKSANLTIIGTHFLHSCTKLKTVVLPDIIKSTQIYNDFLSHCNRLEDIKLPNMPNLTIISDHFLYNAKIKNIDIPPLPNLKIIGDSFMSQCQSLKSIIFDNMPNIQIIKNNFLTSTYALNNINLSMLTKLTYIGNLFMQESGIQTIVIPQSTKIKKLGYAFLRSCKNLKSIDMSPMSGIEIIENYFLSNCEKLKGISFLNMSQVNTIGKFFMNKCSKLKSIDLSPLLSLKEIPDNFMDECADLETVYYPPNVQTISANILNKNRNIKYVGQKNLKPPTPITRKSIFSFMSKKGGRKTKKRGLLRRK